MCIFSAFTRAGFVFRPVDWCLEHHDVFVSEEILNEVCVNLRKRSKVAPMSSKKPGWLFEPRGTACVPSRWSGAWFETMGTAIILGLAMAAKAGLIITGDQDLLVSGQVQGHSHPFPPDAWLQLRKG
jgi:predicted nucleic acid-binding protein